MDTPRMTLTQHLLIASGCAAIGVALWICIAYFDSTLLTAVVAAFGLCFLAGTYADALGLGNRLAVQSIPLMVMLSAAALYLSGDTSMLILAVVLMASAPYRLSERQSWLVFSTANAVYLLVLVILGIASENTISWASLLALQAFALTSSLSRQRELRTQQILEQQNTELIAARNRLAQQSQTEERLRIAGDLHDSLGHRLTALRLQLEALRHEAPQELHRSIEQLQSLSSDLLEEVRAITRSLSRYAPPTLEAALAQLATLTPDVTIKVDGPLPQVSAQLAEQLAFCFREAINNAVRHGGATQISVTFADETFTISDNGKGLGDNSLRPGFGLDNLEHRLAAFAGSVSLSDNGQGCVLRLRIPELRL
jgi:signal transduction histidine kinase